MAFCRKANGCKLTHSSCSKEKACAIFAMKNSHAFMFFLPFNYAYKLIHSTTIFQKHVYLWFTFCLWSALVPICWSHDLVCPPPSNNLSFTRIFVIVNSKFLRRPQRHCKIPGTCLLRMFPAAWSQLFISRHGKDGCIEFNPKPSSSSAPFVYHTLDFHSKLK